MIRAPRRKRSTIRYDAETLQRLERLAASEGNPVAAVVRRALLIGADTLERQATAPSVIVNDVRRDGGLRQREAHA